MTLSALEQARVLKYKPLTYRIVNKYFNANKFNNVERADLDSMAIEALCKASKTYGDKPDKYFIPYAKRTIINEIRKRLPKIVFGITYPVTLFAGGKCSKTAQKAFREGFGIMENDDIQDFQILSFDDIDDKLQSEYNIKLVHRTLNKMPPERAKILKDFYGIGICYPKPTTELAKEYGIVQRCVYDRIYVAKRHFRRLIGEQIDFYI